MITWHDKNDLIYCLIDRFCAKQFHLLWIKVILDDIRAPLSVYQWLVFSKINCFRLDPFVKHFDLVRLLNIVWIHATAQDTNAFNAMMVINIVNISNATVCI